VLGVPLNAPVEVLKLMPAGAAGEIAKLAISPPVELIVKPVATVLTVLLSEDDERVKAGAARVAGKTAVITPELAEFATELAPATVKKLAVTPVRV
jgi:hypothetical protein